MCVLDFNRPILVRNTECEHCCYLFKQIKTEKSQGPKDFCPYFGITGHLDVLMIIWNMRPK